MHGLDLYHAESVQALPLAERDRALRLQVQFESMGGHLRGAALREAMVRLAIAMPDLGLSAKRLSDLYYEWRAGGCRPHCLARRYRATGPRVTYPQAFTEYLLALAGARKRTDARRQAIRALYSTWASGGAVPGYGTWQEHYMRTFPGRAVPPVFASHYPDGWSERSLYRLLGAHSTELVLDQQGSAAAHDVLPGILRDVGALRWMEYIVFDDFRPDIECVHVPTRQIVRAEGLLALDLSTRTVLGFGLQPRQEREDGTRQGLVREDLRAMLYAMFSRHGLPLGYAVTILVENASAAITAEFEQQLTLVFQGRVRIARTGMTTHRNLLYGFSERHGQPWAKGWIEANFRKLHLEAAHLPGQTGPRYDLAPGDRADRVAYTERLLRTAAEWQLPQLRLPLPRFDELYQELENAFDRLADRTDHELQGFQERIMVRLAPHLPPVPREALAELPAGSYDLSQAEVLTRRESPRERAQRLQAQVQMEPVPAWAMRTLALVPRPVTVRGRRIEVTIDGQRRTYAEPGCEVLRTDGAQLTAYYDPLSPTELHLCDQRGAYLASVRELGRVDIRDTEALRIAQERTARVRGEVHAAVRARHADEDAALQAMRAHNAQLLGSQPPPAVATLLAATEAAAAAAETRATVSAAELRAALQARADATQPPAAGPVQTDCTPADDDWTT